MSTTSINADTYIRKLPYSAIQKLVSLLEPDQLWKRFVCCIPKKLDSSEFQERYTDAQVKMIENRGLKPNTYSTRIILDDWGTQNARIRHLISALSKARLYAAADYLAVNQLHGEPVPREPEYNDSFVGSIQLAPREQRHNFENITCEKPDQYNKKKVQEPSNSKPDSTSQNGSIGFTSGDFAKGDSHYRQPEQSDEGILYNRIPSYDSGNLTPDLQDSPCEVSSSDERVSTRVLSAVYMPGTQEIKFAVLQHHTSNFDDRPVSRGGMVVGRGGFGTVYKAIFNNGFVVAVKRLKDPEDPVMLKQFETELKTLATYRHENIVELVGYSIDGPEKCLVYEFMTNGSLEDRLHCLDGTASLSWQLRMEIAYGTAKGIQYLNDNGIVHRDIKSANVLLDEKYVPKVGDFATARLAPSGSSTTVVSTKLVIGTSAYMAPEAIRFDISAKLDSFAFGVVLLEILTGLAPSDNNRDENDLWSHVAENTDDSIVELLDKKAGPWSIETAESLFDVALRCLKDRKKERALVKDILPDLCNLLPKSH